MSYLLKELSRLRKAERMCRARAAAEADGFAALSYSQLADEHAERIALCEAALSRASYDDATPRASAA
ncbi:MAG TPA: hypothetical protein VFA12_13700 [Stellaceae bacterium]|nr:hypothetical protein [Stellaceae bacterium]